MATPSLAMIPSAYADSKVYSVLPNNGDGDFTFNRDSSATRIGQNGLIETVGFFGNELVTNGTFDTNLNNWNVTLAGQTIEWDNGSVKYITDGALAFLEQTITTVVGKVYRATVDINVTIGNLGITVGGQAVYGDGVQTLEMLFTATGTSTVFQLKRKPSAAASGFFDNATFKEVTGDQPRLNYDVNNGAVQSCPSLLLEPASTNLIIQSNQFNTSWSPSGVTLQDNQSGVSGGLNAWKMTEDTSTGQHYVQLPSSLTAGAEQTVTIYAKADERNFLMLNQSGVFRTHYDLVNGTVVSIGTGVTASMESMPDGWWRCIYTATISFPSLRVCVSKDGSTNTYTGDGVSGIYIQYCQNETLSFATSYIPTNGSSQTRAADTCNNAGNAALFNDSEGVLYAESKVFINESDSKRITLSDGSTNNRVSIAFEDSSIKVVIASGGSTVFNNSISGIDTTLIHKIAVKYKANDFALWVDGTERLTDITGATPIGLLELAFDNGNGVNYFYGNTKDLRVYNEALTDAQLQTLTTL